MVTRKPLICTRLERSLNLKKNQTGIQHNMCNCISPRGLPKAKGVMVCPPFPFSGHLWPPPTPSASTLLQLQSMLAQLMQLHCAHSRTNCRSILDPFGPGSHIKGHCLYTLSTFVLFA